MTGNTVSGAYVVGLLVSGYLGAFYTVRKWASSAGAGVHGRTNSRLDEVGPLKGSTYLRLTNPLSLSDILLVRWKGRASLTVSHCPQAPHA